MRKATYRNIQVEILVEYDSGGKKSVAIRAIEGKPFHRNDEWQTTSEYATVNVDELIDIKLEADDGNRKPNLLELALSYSDKRQWYSGESVWLWRNENKGVYLKEQDGLFVTLNVTNYREYLIVFWLNPKTWRWEISLNLGANYYKWINQYRKLGK